MSKVYWTTRCMNVDDEDMKASLDLLVVEPIPFLKWLTNNREKSDYMKCPAVIDFFKNTFVITAPFDIQINIDENTRYVLTDKSQEIYDSFILNRSHQSSDNDPLILTLPPNLIFWSNDDIVIESLPMFLDTSESFENINLIPGTFNISKWIRPLDFTVEVKDLSKPITIKRGEPLFCVKFITKKGNKVELERTELTAELEYVVRGCTILKNFMPKQTLNSVYVMAEKFINRFKNSQKRR